MGKESASSCSRKTCSLSNAVMVVSTSRSPSAHPEHNIMICHMGSLLRSITSRLSGSRSYTIVHSTKSKTPATTPSPTSISTSRCCSSLLCCSLVLHDQSVCKAAHLGRSYLLSVDDGCCSNVGDLCRSSIYGNVLCIILCDSNRILLLCAASHQTRGGND